MSYPERPIIPRFWRKVLKTETCWLWQGCHNGTGYGVFRVKRKNITAHRFSFEIFKGKIPKGMLVMHSCDIRNCVNPEHLLLGTDKDNAEDKVRKGRHLRGEKSPSAVISDDQVSEIKRKYKFKVYGSTKLAKEYGVSQTHILRIIKGQRRSNAL